MSFTDNGYTCVGPIPNEIRLMKIYRIITILIWFNSFNRSITALFSCLLMNLEIKLQNCF